MAMFLYSKWLELSLPIRHEIARLLGIPKVRSTHVSDNRIADDGYDIKTVEQSLSVDRLQTALDTDERNEWVLFDMLVAKAEGREYQSISKMDASDVETARAEFEDRTGNSAQEQKTPKKRDRKPKAA